MSYSISRALLCGQVQGRVQDGHFGMGRFASPAMSMKVFGFTV